MLDPNLQGDIPPAPSTGLYDSHAHLVAADTVRYSHNPIPRCPAPPPREPTQPRPRSVYDGGVIGIRFFGVGIRDRIAWLKSPE